jgi:hypothetical protein
MATASTSVAPESPAFTVVHGQTHGQQAQPDRKPLSPRPPNWAVFCSWRRLGHHRCSTKGRPIRLRGEHLPRTNRYVLTEGDVRITIVSTKVYNRLLVPLTAADQPQAPLELRATLKIITRHVEGYVAHTRPSRAAGNVTQR